MRPAHSIMSKPHVPEGHLEEPCIHDLTLGRDLEQSFDPICTPAQEPQWHPSEVEISGGSTKRRGLPGRGHGTGLHLLWAGSSRGTRAMAHGCAVWKPFGTIQRLLTADLPPARSADTDTASLISVPGMQMSLPQQRSVNLQSRPAKMTKLGRSLL